MSVSNLDDLRSIVIRSIDESSEGLITAAKSVYEIPETGFNERKTSSFVQKRLEELNLSVETGIAITGLKADMVKFLLTPAHTVIGSSGL